mgnify:CR=1 FL=1
MSTAEYHYLLGGYLREREKALGPGRRSVLLDGPRAGGADLHQLSGRQLDRDERRRAGPGRQPAPVRRERRRKRDGGDRAPRQTHRRQERGA